MNAHEMIYGQLSGGEQMPQSPFTRPAEGNEFASTGFADLVTPAQLVAIRQTANAIKADANALAVTLMSCSPECLNKKSASLLITCLKVIQCRRARISQAEVERRLLPTYPATTRNAMRLLDEHQIN